MSIHSKSLLYKTVSRCIKTEITGQIVFSRPRYQNTSILGHLGASILDNRAINKYQNSGASVSLDSWTIIKDRSEKNIKIDDVYVCNNMYNVYSGGARILSR